MECTRDTLFVFDKVVEACSALAIIKHNDRICMRSNALHLR